MAMIEQDRSDETIAEVPISDMSNEPQNTPFPSVKEEMPADDGKIKTEEESSIENRDDVHAGDFHLRMSPDHAPEDRPGEIISQSEVGLNTMLDQSSSDFKSHTRPIGAMSELADFFNTAPKCKLCNKEFDDDDSANYHCFRMHTSNEGCFKCKLCDKYLFSLTGIREHINSIHAEIGNNGTNALGRTNKISEKLTDDRAKETIVESKMDVTSYPSQSLNSEDNPASKRIKLSGSRFSRSDSRHSSSPSRSCSSPLESKRSSRSPGRRSPFKSHCPTRDRSADLKHKSRKNQEKLKCDQCYRRFPFRKALLQHSRDMHSMFICLEPGCDKEFPAKKDLMLHVEDSHRSIEDKMIKCSDCEKEFFTKHAFEQHCNDMHFKKIDPGYVVQCTPCDRVFSSNAAMEQHIRASHDDEQKSIKRKFICKICDRYYSREETIIYHKRNIHDKALEGSKCDFCEKIFNKPYNRKKHMEKEHPKEFVLKYPVPSKGQTPKPMDGSVPPRLYTCVFCPLKFTSHTKCYLHQKSHDKEEPKREEFRYGHPVNGSRDRSPLGHHRSRSPPRRRDPSPPTSEDVSFLLKVNIHIQNATREREDTVKYLSVSSLESRTKKIGLVEKCIDNQLTNKGYIAQNFVVFYEHNREFYPEGKEPSDVWMHSTVNAFVKERRNEIYH